MNLMEKAQLLAAKKFDNPQRVLIYGDSGAGKTTLALQLAKKYKVHLFDLDAGHQVAFTSLDPQYWSNIELYEVEDTPDNARAAKLMDKAIRPATITKFCVEHGEVGCPKCKGKPEHVFNTNMLTPNDVIIIDTFTTHSKSASNFSVGSAIMGGDMSYFKLEFTHHDKQGMILSNFLQRMKTLPCHVVVITHAAKLENLNGTTQISPIGGTKNFAATARRDFDHIVYCYIKNNKHAFTSSTTHNAGIVAKSRSNVDVKETDDIFKLFATDIIHEAAKTKVEFINEPEGPDELSGIAPSGTVQDRALAVNALVQATTAMVPSADAVQDAVLVSEPIAQPYEAAVKATTSTTTLAPKRTVTSDAMLALKAKLGK